MAGWWLIPCILAATGPDGPQGEALHAWVPSPFQLTVEEAGPARLSLSYVLSEPGDVRLELVDDVGRTVVQLVDAEKPAGAHAVAWRAVDPAQIQIVRFGRLSVGSFIETVPVGDDDVTLASSR